MLLQSDFRLNWEDDHEDFSSSLSLSENFKKAFTEIPRLLPSEISLDTAASFDPAFLVTGPSVSFESFNVDAFPVHEEQLYFSIDPDASILEFNETGHLIGASELIVETSTKQALPPSDSAYYGGDIFVSWEDDIFAGALSIPELSVPNSQKLASPALPESPAFTASISESIEIVDVAVCTPKKPKSPKQASRKRATPSSTGPSPKHARTPKSALKDQVSPKRQRRHSSKSSVTFDLEPKVLSFHLDREERAYSSPKLKNCKIGPLSSSTHQLSDSVIRNIFKAEQVVTLSKSEDEDDEDVDIL